MQSENISHYYYYCYYYSVFHFKHSGAFCLDHYLSFRCIYLYESAHFFLFFFFLDLSSKMCLLFLTIFFARVPGDDLIYFSSSVVCIIMMGPRVHLREVSETSSECGSPSPQPCESCLHTSSSCPQDYITSSH